MDPNHLLKREAERRQKAYQILAELCLVDYWRKYGQPVLVGAVAYGLVVHPDIDLEIYCPGDPRLEDGFEVLQYCTQNPRVRDVHFSNRIHDEDQGYYWQIRYRAEDGMEWKVDMWSVRHDHPGPTSRDFVEPMRRALTDETRAAILSIKEGLLSAPVRPLSILVYQAVIEGGARTLAEFDQWRAKHPEQGLIAWKPAEEGEMTGKKSIVLPSTRAFLREGRKLKGFRLFDLLHGYVYGRWVYQYIRIGTGNDPIVQHLAPVAQWIGKILAKLAPPKDNPNRIKFEDTYHGKVVPLEAAKQLVSIQEDINLGDLEQIIPYHLAREIVFQNPDHIAVIDCPCRSAREHPCLPLDVCLIVGEPFASFVIEHHPDKARRISSAEAQDILKAEDARGHAHHAFFKDAMFGRFYAICNCCSCCCGAMHAQQNGTMMLAPSGYAASIDPALCLACRKCEKACPFDAIQVNGKATVNIDKCMGCGVCAGQCKAGAIRLERMESKGMPLEVRALIEERRERDSQDLS